MTQLAELGLNGLLELAEARPELRPWLDEWHKRWADNRRRDFDNSMRERDWSSKVATDCAKKSMALLNELREKLGERA